jgi:hypothetical protein
MAHGRYAWPALDSRPVQGMACEVASGLSVRLPGLERKSDLEEVTMRA